MELGNLGSDSPAPSLCVWLSQLNSFFMGEEEAAPPALCPQPRVASCWD